MTPKEECGLACLGELGGATRAQLTELAESVQSLSHVAANWVIPTGSTLFCGHGADADIVVYVPEVDGQADRAVGSIAADGWVCSQASAYSSESIRVCFRKGLGNLILVDDWEHYLTWVKSTSGYIVGQRESTKENRRLFFQIMRNEGEVSYEEMLEIIWDKAHGV